MASERWLSDLGLSKTGLPSGGLVVEASSDGQRVYLKDLNEHSKYNRSIWPRFYQNMPFPSPIAPFQNLQHQAQRIFNLRHPVAGDGMSSGFSLAMLMNSWIGISSSGTSRVFRQNLYPKYKTKISGMLKYDDTKVWGLQLPSINTWNPPVSRMMVNETREIHAA